jgi:hypothetical protein
MADSSAVRAKYRAGRHPPVVDGGHKVGRGVGRARVAGEEERKWEKEGVCGGGGDRFKSARQGRGRPTGGATWRVRDQRGGPGRPADGAWPIAARDR